MTPDDRSKLQGFINDVDKLRSREPEEKKFKDWKSDVERKLEDAFGKGSDQVARFRRVRFFDFSRGGRPAGQPLSEAERREYFASLEEAKRVLRQLV